MSRIHPYIAGTRRALYVAGKYRDERGEYWIGENIRKAREVMLELDRHGYAVVCPHTQSAFCGGALEDDYDWLDIDREIISRLDGVVFLKDWEQSEGAVGEHESAESLGLPCLNWDNATHWAWLLSHARIHNWREAALTMIREEDKRLRRLNENRT